MLRNDGPDSVLNETNAICYRSRGELTRRRGNPPHLTRQAVRLFHIEKFYYGRCNPSSRFSLTICSLR